MLKEIVRAQSRSSVCSALSLLAKIQYAIVLQLSLADCSSKPRLSQLPQVLNRPKNRPILYE